MAKELTVTLTAEDVKKELFDMVSVREEYRDTEEGKEAHEGLELMFGAIIDGMFEKPALDENNIVRSMARDIAKEFLEDFTDIEDAPEGN